MPRITITVPDKMPQPYRFPLDRQVVMIGRGSENDIVIECGSVSLRHAEMVRIEGGYELRDLDSTNGIKLNGSRSETIGLRHGAAVTLGDVAFDFQLSDEETAELRLEKVLDELPERRDTESAAAEVEGTTQKRASSSGGGKGFMLFTLFLALALAAFVGGLSIRHYKETGGWLLSAIQAKGKTLKASRDAQNPPIPPSTPAPDPTATSDPTAVAPDPAVVAPDPAATPEPAAVTPEPAVVAPDPAAVAPDPAAVAPDPAVATPEPAAATPEQ